MKSQESLPTAIHIHGALHARKQPEAKTNKMTRTFSRSKIQKIKIGIGIHKTIGQRQAQRQANTKGKNHTKIDETNQQIIQPSCQACNQQPQNWN